MAKFEKGQSGNPGGRPKEVAEVRELARQHTPDAINALLEVMSNKDSPPAARVSAATALLDRGHGRPQQALALSGDPVSLMPTSIEIVLVSPKGESSAVDGVLNESGDSSHMT